MLVEPTERKTSGGSYMSEQQLAGYLHDLRASRSVRLNGSRPQPPSRHASKRQPGPRVQNHISDAGIVGLGAPSDQDLTPAPLSLRSYSADGHRASAATPAYREDGARRAERQEARSLRMALQDMDLKEEDERIQIAAQDEASELVTQHLAGAPRKPDLGYKNPDLPQARNDYKAHPRREVFARPPALRAHTSPQTSPDMNAKHDKASPWGAPFRHSPASRVGPLVEGQPDQNVHVTKGYAGLAGAVTAALPRTARRVSSGSKRKVSGGRPLGMHPDDKIYEDPEDMQLQKIEEAKAMDQHPAEIPRHVRRNPFARAKMTQEKIERTLSAPIPTLKRFNSVDIQKNPPSQSRKPWYQSNRPFVVAPLEPQAEEEGEEAGSLTVKDGKEIRSDDIRAATSMRRKDRSQTLPQPTAVSDSPGRPIVSFQTDWKPNEDDEVEKQQDVKSYERPLGLNAQSPVRKSTLPKRRPVNRQGSAATPSTSFPPKPLPLRTAATQLVPMINLPDEPESPSKVLPEEPDLPTNLFQSVRPMPPVPSRNVSTSAPAMDRRTSAPTTVKAPPRPLPTPAPASSPSSRPLPHHSASAPLPAATRSRLTPSARRTTALCAHCALPIAGRVLSAAGERFHPDCFKCHACSTNLECVAFYPEPDRKHHERIARIQQRLQGMEMQVPDGVTAQDVQRLEEADGDEGLHFFCHLDFHELFSPRCKSCATPIEGEVVVACGSEWHVGHFFCAQCGDPFDSSTPFVEKEGYAWCLGCHTNRYSPKCHKCRKPVTDVVVNALGVEWHEACFACMECDGQFEDGRYFLRGNSQDPVCLKCEDRRLKA